MSVKCVVAEVREDNARLRTGLMKQRYPEELPEEEQALENCRQ